MAATLTWPASLPCPQLEPWTGTGYTSLRRVEFDGGNAIQRRRTRRMLHAWQAKWILTQEEYGIAMAWLNEHAAKQFLVTAGSAAGFAVPHSVRLMSTIQSSPVATDKGLRFEVQVLLQWDPQDDAVNMWPDVGDWIIGGTPAAPSAPDWYVAGTPAVPSTEWVLAGTPANPNTNV